MRISRMRLGRFQNRTNQLLRPRAFEVSVARSGKAPEVQHPSVGCSIKWRD